MITKNDCLLLLGELQEKGIDTSKITTVALNYNGVNPQVIKFINSHRQFEANRFYEKLRESYNKKRSKLYINIMKADENLQLDAKTVLTTLSALLNQILQYECEDKAMFLKHARADEIIKVLDIYFNNYNLDPAYKLLALYKADIKVLEMIK